MDDFTKILTHARRLNSATKALSIPQLQDVKAKLEKVIEGRIKAEAEAEKKNAAKVEKIAKYRKMLEADGIELEELVVEAPAKQGKRAPRPPKYEITTKEGKHVTWTGQGRMPNVFKERVEAGDSLDKFLIK